MAIQNIVAKLVHDFADDDNFGVYGPTGDLGIVASLENGLGVKLPADVVTFIEQYGSIQMGYQCLDFVPNGALPGCLELTQDLWQRYPQVSGTFVVIHQDEIVSYLLDTASGEIYAWESFREPKKANFYRTFENLERFILYLAQLAGKG